LLVEVNPAPPVSGTILFNWDTDSDRDILTGKNTAENYPVFRLVTDHVAWSTVKFHPPSKTFIDETRGRSDTICTVS